MFCTFEGTFCGRFEPEFERLWFYEILHKSNWSNLRNFIEWAYLFCKFVEFTKKSSAQQCIVGHFSHPVEYGDDTGPLAPINEKK